MEDVYETATESSSNIITKGNLVAEKRYFSARKNPETVQRSKSKPVSNRLIKPSSFPINTLLPKSISKPSSRPVNTLLPKFISMPLSGRINAHRSKPLNEPPPFPNGDYQTSRNESKELSYVKSLVDKSCDEILLTVHKDENRFLSLLNENVDRDVLALMLITLEKAVAPRLPKHVNIVINNVTSSGNFFHVVTKYLASFQRSRPQNIHCDSLVSLVNFLTKFQTCLPSSASDSLTVLFPLLKKTCELYLRESKDSEIFQKLQEIDVRNNAFLKNFTPFEAKKISFKEQLQLEEPPENFRSIPILPCAEDFRCTSAFIRPNVVSGQYQDTEHYLDVQFRLLREDYVKSLRDGVAEYKELKKAGKSVKKCNNVRVYENVYLTSQQMVSIGLVYIAVFQVKDFSHVKWESSKRFLFGSLLCISDDDFKTMLFAIVAERKTEELKQGKLMVKFENLSEEVLDINPDRKFVVLETTAFFEAYRHNLKALSELDDEKMPMKRYIVDVETCVHHPCYLKDDTTYDMRPLLIPLDKKYVKKSNHYIEYTYPSDIDNRAKTTSVLNYNSWPTASEMDLDPSQYDALKTAVTKEFAIIQGPPGTGKTYIGLRIVQLLLYNKKIWKSDNLHSPILIVCFSNHALDQFLEGLTVFTENIVRIGDRGKNENLEKFKLSNLRRKLEDEKNVPTHIFHNISMKLAMLNNIREEIETTNKLIKASQNRVLNASELESCIPTAHFLSFREERYEAAYNSIYNWLGICVGEIDDFAFRISVKSLSKSDLLVDASGKRIVNVGQRNEQNRYQKLKDSVCFAGEISKHISCVLNYTFSLNSSEVRNIRNVWEINIQFRWRLYKYWVQCLVMKTKGKYLEMKEELRYISNYNERRELSKQMSELKQSIDYALSSVLNEYDLKGYINSMHFKSLRRYSPRGQVRRYYPTDQVFMYYWLELKVKDGNNIKDRIEIIQNLHSTFRLLRDNCKETAYVADQNNINDFADVEYLEAQRDFDSDDIAGASYDVALDITLDNCDSIDFLDGWQVQGGQSAVSKLFREKLCNSAVMSNYEFKNVTNVWKLTIEDRWKLYKYWVQMFIELKKRKKYNLLQNLREKHVELCELRSLKDVYVASKADVIGMTTTGAAKYRYIIESLKPSIVVVEEAAEVLECHVVTSLSPETKHVILIGDHLQLRPNPNIHMLSVKYDLNVSLFERLIKNGLEFVQLLIQHRMRPEIAGLLVPHFYKTLENHASVSLYEDVKGVNKNVFFVSHSFDELQDGDNQSKSNQHEAKYLISLCEYFIKQNYEPSQITILTTYSGQLLELKRLSRGKLKDVRITVVDNYQGEENEIILLSLVRSNDEGEIGFLKISNRVCVALSRARKGLYCIGNFNLLAKNSKLWRNVISYLKDRDLFGSAVQLRCQNHPEISNYVKSCEDFDLVPDGGCKIKCEYRLPCGHTCPLMCHPYDREHENICCEKPCTRICENGHACQRKCFEECLCPVLLNKRLLCEHEIVVQCCIKIEDIVCEEPCERLLECDHKCLNQCAEDCTKECPESITITSSFCGHEMEIQCFQKYDEDFLRTNCQTPCEASLPCGHICSGLCRSCKNFTSHIPCRSDCQKVLPCGHECKSLCFERCALCSVLVLKRSKLCDHEREIECHLKIEDIPCDVECEKILLCGHKTREECSVTVEEITCNEPCEKLLPCGHSKCQKKCGESCVSRCKKTILIVSPFCGHRMEVVCFLSNDGNYLTDRCSAPCNAELKCGHACTGTCSTCHQGRFHIACNQKCKRILICGHNCESICSKACPPCKKPCENVCSHRKCLKMCREPCDPCTEPCAWVCPHKKCSRLCSDLCDRGPCNEPCLKLLSCQHPCLGFCGETCPTVCNACKIGEECFIADGKKYITLEDCGHLFEVDEFSKWINKEASELCALQAILCPRCKFAIKRNYRFGNLIKSRLADIENAKTLVFKEDPSLHRRKIQSLLRSTNPISDPHLTKIDRDINKVVSSKKPRTISELQTMFNFYTLMKVFVNVSELARRRNTDMSISNNCDLNKLKTYIKTTCFWMEPIFRDDFLTASEQQLFELTWELRRLKLAGELLRFLRIFSKGERKKSWNLLLDCVMTYSPFRDLKAIRSILDDIKHDEKRLHSALESELDFKELPVYALNGYSDGNFFKCSKNHVCRALEITDYEMYESACPECMPLAKGTLSKRHSLSLREVPFAYSRPFSRVSSGARFSRNKSLGYDTVFI